jgi:membrane fusion protein
VLQARRARWLGGIVLDQPPAARWLAGLVGLACTLLVAGLATGEYTRRTRVAGQLVPTLGAATAVSPVDGVVVAVHAGEGDPVLAGMPLAMVQVPRATGSGDTGAAVATSLAQRRSALRDAYGSRRRRLDGDAAALTRQLEDARVERSALDAEIATRERQRAIAEQLLARWRTLHAGRHVADLQLRQQEAAALDQLAAAQALTRQRAALERQQDQIAQALAAVPEQRAQLDADEARELAALDQEDAEQRARREAVVSAPIAGRIGTMLVHPGQAVQAGQPLMTVLPAYAELQAHLAVPGPAAGFVAEGGRVRLSYDAFPYQRFGHAGGRVLRVSRDALATGDGEPVYRLVVALDRQTVADADGERALRPGLRVQAELPGETRRLWEWAIEPLRTLRANTGAIAATGADGARDAVGMRRDAPSGIEDVGTTIPAEAGRRVFPEPAPRRLRRRTTRRCGGTRDACRAPRMPLRLTRVGPVSWGRPRSAGFDKERVMRELTMVELEMVEGGNPLLVGALIGAGIIAVGGLALLAYAVHEGCSGSLSISADSIDIEVTCPPPTPTGG